MEIKSLSDSDSSANCANCNGLEEISTWERPIRFHRAPLPNDSSAQERTSGILLSTCNDPDHTLPLHKSHHTAHGSLGNADCATPCSADKGYKLFSRFSQLPHISSGMITPMDEKRASWPHRGTPRVTPILTSLLLGLANARLSRAKATMTLLFSPAQCTTIWLWESFRLT